MFLGKEWRKASIPKKSNAKRERERVDLDNGWDKEIWKQTIEKEICERENENHYMKGRDEKEKEKKM